jgi:hypothetical protein
MIMVISFRGYIDGYDYIRVIVYGLYRQGVIKVTYKSGWE